VLSSPTKFRNGFAKLIPVAEVRAFEEQYVPVKIVAKRYNLDVASLRRHLKTSGKPVLSIPIPEKGRAIFIDRNVAADLNFECQLRFRLQCEGTPPRSQAFASFLR
jgi:hypothetical protein